MGVRENDVTVRYLLDDDLTAPLARVRGEVAATDRQIKQMGTTNAPLLSFFDAMDGKLGNLDRQWAALDARMMSSSRAMQHNLVFGLGAITAGLTAAAGAATFFGLKAVNSFQHTQAAFSVLTGSMQNGQQLYNQLLALNLKSPFDQQPLASSEQTLLGFGFNSRNSLPILQSISNVAAVQQDPNEALMRMSLAIGQINQSGVVRAQDLNQLVQAGFPAYKLIPGGHAGLLAGGGGTIPSSRFLNQLANPNAGPLAPYAGASAAMNQTLSGQWSNLTTLVRQEAIKAFSPLGDELVKEMPHLTDILSGEVKDLAPIVADIGTDLVTGLERLLPVIDPILKALGGGLHELFQAGGPFLDELARQDPAITAALGEFFDTLAGEAPELAALFGDLVQLLPPFIHALDDVIVLVDPFLQLVDGMLGLGPVRQIVGDLLVGLLAYRTLGPAIKAVWGMTAAMGGLATAEEAASMGGGLPLTGSRGRGRTVAGAGTSRWGRFGRGAQGLSGLLGPEAFIGAMLVPADIQYSTQAGHWLSNHINPLFGKDPTYLTQEQILGGPQAAARQAALLGDPKLQRMVNNHLATINIQSGAIVVQNAKDPEAAAKAIRDEMERWINEQNARR